MTDGIQRMTEQLAEEYLIDWLRNPRNQDSYATYGYEVYLPIVIRSYLIDNGALSNISPSDRQVADLSPYFFEAGWELCRRGILRPGIKRIGTQATPEGSSGNGYSVTQFGRQWISEVDYDDFIPTEPGRFAEMLEPYRDRFGPGFYERAQEAIRCYGAHLFLACCAMCGAAAESILLAAAIERRGEERTLKAYTSAGGRGRVQRDLLASVAEPVRREFEALSVLLKYWRDEASHGKAARIANNEAYTSLALLLRLSQSVDEHWSELTNCGA